VEMQNEKYYFIDQIKGFKILIVNRSRIHHAIIYHAALAVMSKTMIAVSFIKKKKGQKNIPPC
jgi:hypothetical protein